MTPEPIHDEPPRYEDDPALDDAMHDAMHRYIDGWRICPIDPAHASMHLIGWAPMWRCCICPSDTPDYLLTVDEIALYVPGFRASLNHLEHDPRAYVQAVEELEAMDEAYAAGEFDDEEDV